MKILIAPFICSDTCDTATYLTSRLTDVLRNAHAVAVCTHARNRFNHVSIYYSPQPKLPLFPSHRSRSVEEHLYNTGGASYQWLCEDMKCLTEAIEQFHPDIIVTINRIAAVPAARKYGIPVIPVVHSCMYQKADISTSHIKDTNRFLSQYGEGQILRLTDLFASCTARIGFGIVETDPFPVNADVSRIGMMTAYQPMLPDRRNVAVCFSENGISSGRIRKTVKACFAGAPYDVYASWQKCTNETDGNLHIIKDMKLSYILRSSVCIHDGSPFITNICHSFGIPQIIITADTCYARFNANSVRRIQSGIVLPQKEFHVHTVYEAYRQCLINEELRKTLWNTAARFRKEQDLFLILPILEQARRK